MRLNMNPRAPVPHPQVKVAGVGLSGYQGGVGDGTGAAGKIGRKRITKAIVGGHRGRPSLETPRSYLPEAGRGRITNQQRLNNPVQPQGPSSQSDRVIGEFRVARNVLHEK